MLVAASVASGMLGVYASHLSNVVGQRPCTTSGRPRSLSERRPDGGPQWTLEDIDPVCRPGTVTAIAHRLASIERADQTVVAPADSAPSMS